ncbi:MAG: TonB-dependent receptor [Prevotellaceae bacterium]|nr:TonB-dependent receptor [Prevotellaceae bacterium]
MKKMYTYRMMFRALLLPAFLLACGYVSAQELVVSGTVLGDDGNPVIGASVVLKGSTKGVITDPSGGYTIQATADGALVFSFMGMNKLEEPINGRGRIDVTLHEASKELDDVVVIGYGTVRKRDLTGAVASVKTSDIVSVPTANPIDAIQGKVPGMDIVRSSGKAGAGVDIVIRGNRSIDLEDKGRNKPLFIIDGVAGGSYGDLNPNDIESIEVLKDASSTAIFGWQGANGVVLITTKKGVAGQARIAYDGYYGVNGMADYPDPRMGEAYMQLRRDAWSGKQDSWRNDRVWNAPPSDDVVFDNIYEYDAMKNNQWVNWVDLLQRNAVQQSHSVSVRGGTDKTKAFMSVNYFEEEGTVRLNDAQRITARLNLDQTVNKWVKAGMTSQYTHWDVNNRSESALKDGLTLRPLGVPYDEEGKMNIYPIEGLKTYTNPMLDEYGEGYAVNNDIRNRLALSAYVEIQPVEGLKLTSSLGANINNSRTGIYQDSISADIGLAGPNRAEYNTTAGRSIRWENVLTFKKTFADVHSLTLTGVTTASKSISEESSMSGRGVEARSYSFYKMTSTASNSRILSTGYTQSSANAVAGRLEYGLMDRYLLMASIRWDGTSRLPNNQWDYFPAVSAAWRIGEESFMQKLPQVSDLKLRASYGVSGNSGIDEYGTQSLVEIIENKFAWGDVAAPTYGFGALIGTNDLGWEKTATIDVGIDAGLLKNRISLTLDYYYSSTTDILMQRTIPTTSGGQGTSPFKTYQNIAATRNYGLELAANTVNVEAAGFRWTSTLTFSTNKEEIVSLYDGLEQIVANSLFVGYPVKSFYDYTKLGIWQLGEASEAAQYYQDNTTTAFKPGDIKLKNLQDTGGNGVNTITAEDKSVIGSAVPDWFAGFSNTFTYKGVDLSVYLFARWGQMINAEFLGRYDPMGVNNGPAYFDYWTPSNPTNDFPAPGQERSAYFGVSSLSYVDGSYFKVKTLTLGYTLPVQLARKVKLEKLRVYATANNLFTKAASHLIQHYDPERGGSEKSPLSKQFVVGLNFEF